MTVGAEAGDQPGEGVGERVGEQVIGCGLRHPRSLRSDRDARTRARRGRGAMPQLNSSRVRFSATAWDRVGAIAVPCAHRSITRGSM